MILYLRSTVLQPLATYWELGEVDVDTLAVHHSIHVDGCHPLQVGLIRVKLLSPVVDLNAGHHCRQLQGKPG